MDIRTAINVAITLLQTIVTYTATTIDDNILAVLKAVVENDALLRFFESLLSDPSILNTKDAERTQNINLAAQSLFNRRKNSPEEPGLSDHVNSAGLGTTFWVMLPLVVRLLLTIMGKRR